METYVFDDTLEGLLTLVFDWYNRKPGAILVNSEKHYQPSAFNPAYVVSTDAEKATRVATGLQKKLTNAGWRNFHCTFLSELPEAFQHLFQFAIYVFSEVEKPEDNYGNDSVLYIAQMARKVEREKHHLEAFIRFQQTRDGMYYAPVEPKYNVLPLIAKHFKDRYADQAWIIYDHQRRFGLYYDLRNLEVITIDFQRNNSDNLPAPISEETNEEMYQLLWKDYFKSTNIESRRNIKLQVRSMPRRFWRYLTEKQIY